MKPTGEIHILKPILLQRLADQQAALLRLIESLNEETPHRESAGGKWSPKQHLAHLARYQQVFLLRLNRIADEDRPRLDQYNAEHDLEWPAWERLTLAEVLERWTQSRTVIVRQLDALPDASFSRVGIHEKFGPLSLADWLEFFLVHEGHHMYTIFKARHPSE